ncbi:aspartate/glutamate racemase family protein [Leucobacter denitrificans]|uniref:Aspartate/glutamate racemase family protein n=1 Tax=Leucobacter denitrificans TaxID=683042 RepID=A0A7G9S288_9MICO|nr:aspartate/glutamate racemase family protein [Leucobacter denitrificans]QNN61963.1 aspartate/glutamate racemase family protein [Leucobacter denitrificans]
MMRYVANTGIHPAGIPIGVIMMNAKVPYPPGSPNNARTFEYPVTHETIAEANYESLIYAPAFDKLRDQFIEAGHRLVERGVKAVVGSCGFMVLFQRELAEALPVPVYSSSLIQLPLISQTISPAKQVGILTFSAESLTSRHMEIATAGLPLRYVIHGLSHRPAFRAAVAEESGSFEFEEMEADLVAEALEMQKQNPDLGAILLECTDLPPYAPAIRKATGLPVHDVMTLIDWAHRAAEPRVYPHMT